MDPRTPIRRTTRDELERALRLGSRWLRRWWVIGVSMLAGLAVGVLAALIHQDRFKSEALILHREGIRWSALGNEDAGPNAALRAGLRLRELVMARPRLEQVIKELGLYPGEEPVEALEHMYKDAEFRVRDGDTYALSYLGNTPEEAKKVTERLTQVLIDENSRYGTDQAMAALTFVDEERERAEIDLQAQESELAQFLARHPEFAQDMMTGNTRPGASIRAGSGASSGAASTGTGSGAIGALEREASRLRRRLSSSAEEGAEPEPVVVSRTPGEEERMAEAELLAARQDLNDKRARFTEQHPDVLASRQRVQRAEARYRRAKEAGDSPTIRAPAPANPAEAARIRERLAQVERELTRLRRAPAEAGAPEPAPSQSGTAQEIVLLETEWSRLNRGVNEARVRYEQIDQRHFVASMTLSSQGEESAGAMVVVNPAFEPRKPTGLSRKWIVALGMAGGLALGIVLSLMLAIADDRLLVPTDVNEAGLGPVLTWVPVEGKRRG